MTQRKRQLLPNGKAYMHSPTFDSDGDPTEETLAAIEGWKFDSGGEKGCDPWAKFVEFVKKAWNLDYGAIREESEDGKNLLCFITGGWSSNEAVQGAMNRNMMFRLMRWHSSYRGGVTKYLVK